MNKSELLNHTKNLMEIGIDTVRNSPQLTAETGTYDPKGTPTIEMDKTMERVFKEYIQKNNLPVVMYSEDSVAVINMHANPEFTFVVDALDGSTNYRIGQRLRPFGSFFAFFDSLTPQLKNVVVAGAVEYKHNLGFLYTEGRTIDKDNNEIHLKADWQLKPVSPTIDLEIYQEGYHIFAPLDRNFRILNQGALVYSLVCVLSNASALMGGIAVKSEEIGAIYGLITGAGGVVVDLQGNDIGNQPLDHTKGYEILAGNKSIVEYALSYVKRNR